MRESQAEREPTPSPVGRAWFRLAARGKLGQRATTPEIHSQRIIELNPGGSGLVPILQALVSMLKLLSARPSAGIAFPTCGRQLHVAGNFRQPCQEQTAEASLMAHLSIAHYSPVKRYTRFLEGTSCRYSGIRPTIDYPICHCG